MSINLMDQFKGLLTNAVVGKIAGMVGGESSAVSKALTTAGGAVLASAMDKASTQEGAKGLFDMLGDGSALDNLDGQLQAGSDMLSGGSDFAQNLLGGSAEKVIKHISEDSDLSIDSARSVLGIGGGLMQSMLGKQAASGGIGSLVGLLGNQGSFLEKLFPSLGGLLGLGSLAALTGKIGDIAGSLGGVVGDGVEAVGDAAGAAADKVGDVASAAADKVGDGISAVGKVGDAALDAGGDAVRGGAGILGKLIPLALLALLAFLAFSLFKQCSTSDVVDDVSDVGSSMVEGAGDMVDGAVEGAGNVVEGAGDMVDGAVEGAGDALAKTGELAGDAVDGAGDALAKTGELAGDAVEGAGDMVDGAVEGAGDALEKTGELAGDAATKVGDALNAFGKKIGELFSFELPGGVKIDIPKGGFEENFLTALGKGDLEAGTYYDFDRLYFATGSDALNAESNEQVDNAAAILKAYPDLKVLLRGHTDNTGQKATNLTLSKERADAVKAKLVDHGISADRITTSGVADEFPAADNATEEGRQRNRRIDISVSK